MPQLNRLYSVEIPEGNDFVETEIECLVAAQSPEQAARLFLDYVAEDYGIEDEVEMTLRNYGETAREEVGVINWTDIEMTKITLAPTAAPGAIEP